MLSTSRQPRVADSVRGSVRPARHLVPTLTVIACRLSAMLDKSQDFEYKYMQDAKAKLTTDRYLLTAILKGAIDVG